MDSYQKLSSPYNPHLQSGIFFRNTHVFWPSAADKWAMAESMVIIRSQFKTIAAVSEKLHVLLISSWHLRKRSPNEQFLNCSDPCPFCNEIKSTSKSLKISLNFSNFYQIMLQHHLILILQMLAFHDCIAMN